MAYLYTEQSLFILADCCVFGIRHHDEGVVNYPILTYPIQAVYGSLNKAQRARDNERNMSTRATLTCTIHTICALLRVKKTVFARTKAHISRNSDCD